MINVFFLCVCGLISSVKWSSVKWTVQGKPGPELNKIIFSSKPSGPF